MPLQLGNITIDVNTKIITITHKFKSVMIICSWLLTFVATCKIFLNIFDEEILHNMLKYTYVKIKDKQARKINAAVCFSLLLLKWM